MGDHSSADDLEHLKLLVIFHWIVAAIVGVFGLIQIFHLLFGIAIVSGRFPVPSSAEQDPFPVEFVGWFLIAFSVAWILASFAMAFCLALSARNLAQHRRRTFCMVIAGVSCVFFPFGTALGVFTLVVLSRGSVRELFDGHSSPVASAY